MSVLAASLLTNPLFVTVVLGVPGIALGYFAWQRAQKLDREAVLTAEKTALGSERQQVIDGLNTMVNNLQGDNKVLRRIVTDCDTRIKGLSNEIHELKHRLSELIDKYNGE